MKKSPQKKHVLLVSEYFLPHWTGISQAFFYLARNLTQQGYAVTVLTTQFDPSLPRKETCDNIQIIRAPFQLRISRTHYSIAIIITFLRLITHYDSVIINSPNSNILFFSIFSKLLGKKLAIYHQGDLTLPRQTGNKLVHKFLELLFDCMTIPSFIMCDIASTYTKDYAEHSRVMKYALYKFRPYIPHFPISTKKPSAVFATKILTLSKNHVIVGFAGRFVEEKGYDLLVKAIPHVLEKVPNALFVFAGKTDIDYEPFFALHKKIINKYRSNLVFLGLLSKNDLTAFYNALDVFVISSRSDCFPTTQIEVVAHNVPIVVTDIPGARMLVASSGFGYVVEKENVKSLALGIVKGIHNKKTLMKNQQKALQYIQKYENFRLD